MTEESYVYREYMRLTGEIVRRVHLTPGPEWTPRNSHRLLLKMTARHEQAKEARRKLFDRLTDEKKRRALGET
jgi:hypothetical protein